MGKCVYIFSRFECSFSYGFQSFGDECFRKKTFFYWHFEMPNHLAEQSILYTGSSIRCDDSINRYFPAFFSISIFFFQITWSMNMKQSTFGHSKSLNRHFACVEIFQLNSIQNIMIENEIYDNKLGFAVEHFSFRRCVFIFGGLFKMCNRKKNKQQHFYSIS